MNKTQIRKLKKLWVEVNPDLYDLLKSNAIKRNIKFTKYINRALLRYSIKEELYENEQVAPDKEACS